MGCSNYAATPHGIPRSIIIIILIIRIRIAAPAPAPAPATPTHSKLQGLRGVCVVAKRTSLLTPNMHQKRSLGGAENPLKIGAWDIPGSKRTTKESNLEPCFGQNETQTMRKKPVLIDMVWSHFGPNSCLPERSPKPFKNRVFSQVAPHKSKG